MYVHHDEIGEELRRLLLPLHHRYQGSGDVLFRFNANDRLQFLAERRVIGLQILEKFLVHLHRQYVNRLEATFNSKRRRLFERSLVTYYGIPFLCQVARRHVVYRNTDRTCEIRREEIITRDIRITLHRD